MVCPCPRMPAVALGVSPGCPSVPVSLGVLGCPLASRLELARGTYIDSLMHDALARGEQAS
eukprot:scaffold70775_cov20-Tisochrysis_lutea.AAC.2